MYPDQSQNYPVQQTYPVQQSYPHPSYQQPSYSPPPQYPSQQTYQSQPYPSQQRRQESYGVIDSIQIIEPSSNAGPGLGAVAGALVGGLLGNQVGKGNGRTAATVAGAIGGGLVGNNVENSRRQQGPAAYLIRVRLDDGSFDTLTQDNVNDLGVGSRVRIDSGRVYRY
ncbi:MAG: glycine zipper 2TM domain-containing protein [Herminiimonas sp.]|nr:glycine zipper 2TM domain-containing protein [Herminiimonas sp.]